ncbi:hypothetical protein HDV05_007607, partial [Chytridiales sp. JEL 0842]
KPFLVGGFILVLVPLVVPVKDKGVGADSTMTFDIDPGYTGWLDAVVDDADATAAVMRFDRSITGEACRADGVLDGTLA